MIICGTFVSKLCEIQTKLNIAVSSYFHGISHSQLIHLMTYTNWCTLKVIPMFVKHFILNTKSQCLIRLEVFWNLSNSLYYTLSVNKTPTHNTTAHLHILCCSPSILQSFCQTILFVLIPLSLFPVLVVIIGIS